MKKSVLLTLALSGLISFCLPVKSYSQSLLIQKVNIINVLDGSILKGQNVLIQGDSIAYIGSKKFKKKGNAQRITAEGKFLIPVLWDSHVHLTLVGESSIPLFINSGVTQVRDMGGDYSKIKQWKSSTSWKTPLVKSSGPILESPQFIALLNRVLGPSFSSTRIPLIAPAQIERVVDSLQTIGVDFIKIRTAASATIINELARVSKAKNISLTGHIAPNNKISEIVDSGIATIEHYDFLQIPGMKAEEVEAALQAIERNKPSFTPTLIAFKSSRLTPLHETVQLLDDSLEKVFSDRKYLSPSLLEAWSVEVKLNALESKIKWDSLDSYFIAFASEIAKRTETLAGTDVGVRGIVPGKSLHQELHLMVTKLGISPLAALQSATINPSRELNVLNKYGTVEVGKKANLVLLNSNPMLDITNTTDIYAIVNRGRYIGKQERELLLKEVEQSVKNERLLFTPVQLNHLNKFLKSIGR